MPIVVRVSVVVTDPALLGSTSSIDVPVPALSAASVCDVLVVPFPLITSLLLVVVGDRVIVVPVDGSMFVGVAMFV